MELKSQNREVVGKKVKNIRKQNLIPASVYGPNQPSVNLVLDSKEFKSIFKEVGHSKLFDFIMPDGKSFKALLKDVQFNYLGTEILHVSIYKVDEKQKISTFIPLEFEGFSMAVKNNLGILVTSVTQVEIKCLPSQIPSKIIVNINKLDNVGDKVFLKEIKLPEGVEIVGAHAKDIVLAAISAPQKAIEEETPKASEVTEEGKEDTKEEEVKEEESK